jgi:shikimate dehydrogenase
MQVELKNTTKKLCVIGDPVLHSKSPLIQNTMIRALGLAIFILSTGEGGGAAACWMPREAGYADSMHQSHKLDLAPAWTNGTRTALYNR